MPLTTLWENDYPLPVKLKSETNGDPKLGDIKDEYIHSLIPGISVPLRQIARVEPDWTQGKIVRRNGVRTISIVGDVTRDANINEVFRDVKKIAEQHVLPAGLSLSYGGAHETDAENLPPILSGLAISVFIIFLILVFHFRKINMALLVLGSATLSFAGAIAGILILGKEIGLTSLLGIVSLIGILVRNGIIMLDYAEELRHVHRKTAVEAAIEAGKRRMRPIFLTSAAASMGVIPMIISNSSLWSAMGTIICFGTMTSMVLLVLILPVAYWLVFRRTDNPTNEPSEKRTMKPVITILLGLVLASPSLQAQQNTYTLEQCKRLALQNNAEVRNKMLGVESAREVKKAAFTKYFPQVEATALAFRFDKPLMELEMEGGNLPVYDGNPANLNTATQFAYFPPTSISMLEKGTIGMATATQPVYAGSQIATGNKLANLGVEVSELQLTSAQNQIALQTENQYWQIVSLNEKMKTLEQYIQMVDTLRKEVADAYQAGLTTRNDLLKVELKQNELQMNKLKLANGIELARMALCQYMGVPYKADLVFTDTIPAPAAPELIYTDHQQALAKRAEYQMLQKSSEAEKYQTKMQRGEFMPQVGVGVSAIHLDIMNTEGSSYGGVFGTVKIPISGWWEASHKMKERRLKEEQNQNTVNDHTEKLLLQMQQAKNTLNEAYRQVQLSEVSVRQAEENLKVNRDHYEAGLINVSDMLDAQAQFQESHNQYIDALSHYQVTRVGYLQMTGR